MISKVEILERKSKAIRINVLKSLNSAGTGHTGGSLSCVDILVALYFDVIRHSPYNNLPDKFILSKGHAAPTLYAILSECGYFSKDELKKLRKDDCYLQGHPCSSISGVEASSGSLGQGLSIACGLALSMKINERTSRVFVLMGDGECNEGQIWEAAMFASHNKLDNLVAIIDRNMYQIDGTTEEILSLEPFKSKWESFGWEVSIIDGHNFTEILNSLNKYTSKPHVIIANTIKGKGTSITEGSNRFHGKVPSEDEMITIMKEFE